MALVFGKYEKIRRIAQGGMGEVFLARQTGVLDRLAILKALRPDLAKEREFVDQFLDEARVAATLNHPNIVAIYDVGDWNGIYYIAMEYIAGEDLSKLWYAAAKAGVGLPFQVSVRIVHEAALGLDHAHRAKDVRGKPLNIVHRDISPQNIMVRADGVTKLVDFGIAKAANKSSRTQAGMVKGKLQYMSPEQVRGEPLDGRSDQFSLGVVLWEMCTGRRLFKADTEIKTLQKILQDPIPRPTLHVPGFPAELEAVIMKMLERDPARRFATLGDVALRLKEYLDRSSLQSGEVSVAAFVQQILGKELEERTRDLTPMEPTEVEAPLPPPSSRRVAQRARLGEDEDPPTLSDAGTEPRTDESADALGGLSTGPSGEWVVKKADGSVVHFHEWATLQQWVLDGRLLPQDQLSTDGRRFSPLANERQLAQFFATAALARQSAKPAPVVPAPVPAPVAVDPPPSSNTSVTTTSKRVADDRTQPLGDAELADAEEANAMRELLSAAPPATADQPGPLTPLTRERQPEGGAVDVLQDPLAPAPTGAFSLGALPNQATGQWQLGGQQALAATLVPGTDPRRQVATDRVRRPTTPKKVPLAAWAAVGVLGSLVAVAVLVRIAAPDTFRALVAKDRAAPMTRTRAALAALHTDDVATIAALADSLQPLLGDDATVDADVAAALLALQRWRVARAAASISGADDTGAAAALDTAQRHARRAVAHAGDGADAVWARFAAACVEGATDRGARDRALATAGDHELLLAEARVAEVLADGLVALAARPIAEGAEAPLLREYGDDKRPAGLAALLSATRVATTKGAETESVRATFTQRAQAAPSDPRPAAVLRLLSTTPSSAPSPPPPPAEPAVVVDAGSAPVVVDAGVAGSEPVVVDAGVAVVEETYESALQKGQKASKAGRSGEAVKMFRIALDKKPGDTKAQLLLSWALLDVGKNESAAKGFRAVLAKGQNPEAQFGLGEALRAAGRTTEAVEAFQKYLEIAPDGPDAETARNAINALQ